MRRRQRGQHCVEMFSFTNPSVPFQEVLREPLRKGTTVTVQGTVKGNAKGFSINLQSGKEVAGWHPPNKAFHFNPRFNEIVVVRNTFQGNKWGPEERYGTFPFHYGQTFTIVITVTDTCFKVSVNSTHFTDYAHRIPISEVNTLSIHGDIMLHRVSASIRGIFVPVNTYESQPQQPAKAKPMYHQIPGLVQSRMKFKSMDAKINFAPQPAARPVQQNECYGSVPSLIDLQPPLQPTVAAASSIVGYPIHLTNLVTPTIVNFPGNLAVGHTIYISATPTGSSFGVYFEKGVDVAFLFNPRFISSMAAVHNRIQSSVIRNSLQNGQWGTEERQLPVAFPFQLNVQFDLLIKVLPDRYDVTVNGRQLVTFAHRIFPIGQVTNMAIKGDVAITSIYVQK